MGKECITDQRGAQRENEVREQSEALRGEALVGAGGVMEQEADAEGTGQGAVQKVVVEAVAGFGAGHAGVVLSKPPLEAQVRAMTP